MSTIKHQEARYGVAEPMANVLPINSELSPMKIEVVYFNNLEYPVRICNRDGTVYDIRPQHNANVPRQFYITKRITYDPSSAQLHLPNNTLFEENAKIHEVVSKEMAQPSKSQPMLSRYRTISIQYCVEDRELRLNPTYYLVNLDLVVSCDFGQPVVHPFSPEGSWYRQINENNANDPDKFTLTVEIIAPDDTIRAKYINLANGVYRVPVKRSSIMQPGVYITYRGKTDVENPPSPARVDVYSLSDLSKGLYENKEKSPLPFMFYDSVQDALCLGDTERARKHQLEQMQFENNKLKADIDRLKLEANEAELQRKRLEEENKSIQQAIDAELKRREEAQKHADKLLELEMEMKLKQQKHEQELRSMDRKDASEFVKWIPTMIGGFLAITALLIKAQK